MKKLISTSTILILTIAQLFAVNGNNKSIQNNNIINEKIISTTLYYGDSTELVLNQNTLLSNSSEITKPFFLKANGNIYTVTTIFIGISSEYFHNSILTSKIKPKVYLLENSEIAGYRSIGKYKSIENDPTVTNNAEYHSIVTNETNTEKGQALKSKYPHLDTIFSVTLPHTKHKNDTILVFAFTWDTQTYLFNGDFTSSITVSYFTDL